MAEEIVGYRRVVDADCCEFCTAVDGAFVFSADPMPLHPGCGCSVEPVTAEERRNDLAGKRGRTPNIAELEQRYLSKYPEDRQWLWADDAERYGLATPEDIPSVEPGTPAGAAAKSYTAGGFKDLNRRLREGEELTPEQAGIRDALEAEMRDLPERPTVFRGVRIGPERRGIESEEELFERLGEWAEAEFLPGTELEMLGLQSTSFDLQPALDAALSKHSPGIIFEIRAREGTYLGRVTTFDDESELLLRSGARFRVRKVLRSVEGTDSEGEPIHPRVVIQLIQI